MLVLRVKVQISDRVSQLELGNDHRATKSKEREYKKETDCGFQ
jgi:hypothetical protein